MGDSMKTLHNTKAMRLDDCPLDGTWFQTLSLSPSQIIEQAFRSQILVSLAAIELSFWACKNAWIVATGNITPQQKISTNKLPSAIKIHYAPLRVHSH